ncbi:MAG TPA: hypothetical protein VMF09_06975 [Solirubrobacteraceae bacterium]|nr:hypothetical protein [Solirubrobacteraceae bacterium]
MSAPATARSRPAARPRPGREGRRRRRRFVLPAATAPALALALAGCGGSSSSPGVAHVATTNASDPSGGSGGGTPGSGETLSGESVAAAQRKLVKFAQCMRTHGEPQFPGPNEGNIHIEDRDGHGPNPESAQWKAAEKACSKYAPANVAPSPAQQKAHQEQALKFSECMRHNGVPNFPDPKFSSGGGVNMNLKGIDPGSPQFQAAAKACQSNSPFAKLMAKGPPGAKAGGAGGSGGQSSQQTAVAP